MNPSASAATGLVVVMCATLVACGGEPPDDLFMASRKDHAAPEKVRQGSATRCGDFIVRHDQQLPTSAATCFSASIGRAEAELAVVVFTEEGDPVVRFFQSSAGRPGYEAYVNATWDESGSRGWYQLRCPGSETFLPDLVGCEVV